MAMLECDLHGSLFEISEAIDRAVNKSVSASVEDESYCEKGNCACSVKVYERYSYIGGNRVSLSVTLFACGEDVHLTALSSGGSQAVLSKSTHGVRMRFSIQFVIRSNNLLKEMIE